MSKSKSASNLKAKAVIAPKSAYRFSARLFSAIAHFRAKSDIRYYLNGMLFMPHPKGGAMMVATNGHQLAVAYDPEGAAPADRIVSVFPGLESAACRYPAGWVHMDEALDSRVVLSDSANREVYVQPGKALIEGKFPNVYGVMPADPSKLQSAMVAPINAMYFGCMATMVKRLRLSKYGNALHHWQQDETTVCVTRPDGEPNVMVLTMPMRCDRPDIVEVMQKFRPATKPQPEAPAPQPSDAAPPPANEPAPAPAPVPEPDAVQIALQALQAAATALAAISANSKPKVAA